MIELALAIIGILATAFGYFESIEWLFWTGVVLLAIVGLVCCHLFHHIAEVEFPD